MAVDFRTDQIRFSKLIASGGIDGTKPHLGLLIYSSSKASNYTGTSTVSLANVGNDVWMVVDGSPTTSGPSGGGIGGPGFPDGSTVLFLGNVVVSGTLKGQRSIVQVNNTVGTGDFVAGRGAVFGSNQTSPDPMVVVDKMNKVFAFGVLTGSTSGSNISTGQAALSFPYYPLSYVGANHKDVNFHVGGIKGSRGTSGPRGTALFDGDLVVSGNLKTHGSFAFTPLFDTNIVLDNETAEPPSIGWRNTVSTYYSSVGFQGGNLILAVTGSGDIQLVTDAGAHEPEIVTVKDGDIRLADGKAVYFFGTGNGSPYIKGEASGDRKLLFGLRSGGRFFNVVATPSPVEFDPSILLPGYSNDTNPGQDTGVTFYGEDGTGTNTIRYLKSGDNSRTYSALELLSTTADIRVRSESGKLYLSASGGVEVTSDLIVSGAFVKMKTVNAEISDPVFYMASGALASNQNGGIAIASGSSVSSEALVFGRVANDTWGVGRKDVQEGNVTTLADMTLTNFRAAKVEVGATTEAILSTGNTLQFSGSAFSFEPSKPLILNEERHTQFFVSASAPRDVILESDQDLALYLKSANEGSGGPYINFYQGGSAGPTIYRSTSAARDNFTIKNTVGKLELSSKLTHGAEIQLVASKNEAEARQRRYLLLVSQSHEIGNTTTETEPTGFAVMGGYSNDAKANDGASGWVLSGSDQKDTSFFVSGAIGCKNTNTRGAAVFGGDLIVSGNFYPGGGVLKVQAVRVNPLDYGAAPGYIRFGTDAGGDEASFEIARDSGHLKFKDTQSPAAGSGYTLTQLAALAVVDNTDVFAVTDQNGSSPFLSYVATTGSFSFDHNPNTNGYTARRTNQIGDDVYFFVSGAVDNSGDTWDSAWRGASVFGGDIVTSGSITTNTLRVQTSGNGADIRQRSGAGDIKFFVDKGGAGTQVEAMRLTNGGANIQLGADSNSDGKLAFALEANAYVQFINGGGSPNTLKIVTDENAGDKIQLTTGTGDTAATGGTIEVRGDIVPTGDREFNLGSPANRWANVYTGDLHLKNERGDWTIVEESDYLCVSNNATGKKYKMVLEPLGDNE